MALNTMSPYTSADWANPTARLMRVITAMGICTEVGSERYTSNALNEVLVQPGYTAGVKFL